MVSLASRRCPQCGHPVPAHAPEGLCGACLLGGALAEDRLRRRSETRYREERALGTIGGYELLRRIGYGGMGMVFEARHPDRPGRVAVKTIAAGDLAAPQDVRRFRTEAETIARLAHPHIVPVHDFGEDDGRHYFVMMLATGGSLAAREGDGGGARPREAAAVVVKVARAVHFAHQRGILHRDLKPGNILLDADGEPMVADFGLAKLMDGSAQLTLAGAALGTPSYMAPEQAHGRPGEVTTAADVYSLGAILYFLLTGGPPFTAATAIGVLRQVHEDLPVAPRRAGAAVDRDLERICMRCLEKDPAARYAGAGALADDLERWQRGDPIEARPATVREQLRRWARRRPVAAATALLGAVAVLTLAVVLAVATVMFQEQRNLAREHEVVARRMATRAETEAGRTRLNLYAADMLLASRAIEEGNLGLARASLRRHAPGNDGEDLRGFEWFACHAGCAGEDRLALRGHEGAVTALAFDPTGTRLATAGRDERVRIWSVADGAVEAEFPRSDAPAREEELALFPALVVRSPELTRMLLRGEESFDGIRMRGRPSRLGEQTAVAWSSRGDRLATGSIGAYLRIWSLPDGALQGIISVPFTRDLAFTPGDERLVVAVDSFGPAPDEVRIYDPDSLECLRALPGFRPLFGISADGTRLAVVRGVRDVEIQDLESGKRLAAWSMPGIVHRLALSPDGNRAAILEDGGRVLAFRDVATGRSLGRIGVGPDRLNDLAFSPDGGVVAAAGSDHAVHLYDATTFTGRRRMRGHGGEVLAVEFSPASGALVSGGNDHTARSWTVDAGPHDDPGPPVSGQLVDVSADGRRVLLQVAETTVACLDADGTSRATVTGEVPLEALGFHRDGGRFGVLLPGGDGEPVIAWHEVDGAAHGEPPVRPDAPPDWFFGGAHGSSGQLLLGTKTGGVVIHDLSTGRRLRVLETSEALHHAEFLFSEDGSRLAARQWPRTLTIWDTDTGRRVVTWKASSGTIAACAFSPDGTYLASAGDDNLVSVWTAVDAKRVVAFRGHKAEVKALAFSPDGRTLASAGRDLAVRLWHVPTWRDLGVLRRGELFGTLRFTPDGDGLLGAGGDAGLRRIAGRR